MELLEEVVKHSSYLTRCSLKLSSHLGEMIVNGVTTQPLLSNSEYHSYRQTIEGVRNELTSPEVERIHEIRKKVIGDPHQPNRLDPTSLHLVTRLKPKRLIF